MASDLVCGMNVEIEEAKARNLMAEHKGRTFYFCSEECRSQFEANPEQFLGTQSTSVKGSAKRETKSGGEKQRKAGTRAREQKHQRMG
jgi:YHS domain-containing protein